MNGDPRSSPSPLERVVAACRVSDDHHEWEPPASEDELALAEARLGRGLPTDLRRLYGISNGMSLFDGNVNLYPVRASTGGLGLLTEELRPLAEQLRDWEWRIPPELVVIGDNGGDETFGLWLPAEATTASAPVIEIAEGGDPWVGLEAVEGLAVAGTALAEFLISRMAYFAILLGADPAVLDALGVPVDLRDREPDDALFAELCAWADPALRDPDPHPYAKPVGAQRLRELFGSDAP